MLRFLLVTAMLTALLPVSGRADAMYSSSMAEVVELIGAGGALSGLELDGAGIDVAVIDTGVEPVPGLDGPNKLVTGPDLSFEAGLPEFYGHDTYGHGTVMASIIAGDDGPGGFQGVAPGARIVSVKVADNTGAADVSQVIAALDWVVAYGRQDGLNVRVINLSYVTDSEQSYDVDPLAHAVERAWNAGYVVVVAAGNHGEDSGTLGNPAADPYVIAVAAADEDGEAEFSNEGSHTRVPDVLAPGHQILGLAAPNSRLVQEYPQAFIAGRFLRGSGTSQASAVVSGAAALLLQQRPDLTPDQVKALLIMGTVDEDGRGNGAELDAIKGLSEYFDLIDLEGDFRSEARALREAASSARAQGDANRVSAAAVRDEASALLEEAGAVQAEAERLDEEADDLPKTEKKRMQREVKALEDEAKELEQRADDLDEEAADLTKEADDLENDAADFDEEAQEADDEADQIHLQAEKSLVPDHVRETKRAEQFREDAVDYRARSSELRAEAAPIWDHAELVFDDAEVLRDEAATLYVEAAPYFQEAAPYFDQAKRLSDEAKELRDQAKRERGSKANRLKDEAAELKAEAKELESQGDAIAAPGVALEKQAKTIEDEAKAIERDAEDLAKQAEILEDAAEDYDKDAEDADDDAGDADTRSDEALTELEEQIAGLFTDWDGRRMGEIRYDDRQGAGLIDVERSAAVPTFDAVQSHTPATGTGTLEGARGSNHVTMPDGSMLTGEVTFTGNSWSGNSWSGNSWSGNSWSGNSWSGNSWSGNSWSGNSWSGATWSGNSWSGATWSGNSWSGNSWSGNSWSGNSWSGNSWSGNSWSGSSWSGASWS